MGEKDRIRSVAIIGAGASGKTIPPMLSASNWYLRRTTGAVAAAAFLAENYYEKIRVFERRESPGGTW
jgi:cation diffusion facilitator CzcD-associated flavoprotein CzcO